MAQAQKQLFFVLGMHRSGTSTLTRALRVCCVDIGNHYLARADNPKGFFENPDFVEINEEIFQKLGISWQSLTRIPTNDFHQLLTSTVSQKARLFLRSLCQNAPLCALKDPRASRLLPFWIPLCLAESIAPKGIICLRNPKNVAASLKKRDDMPKEHAYDLWSLYTAEALFFSQGLSRILVSYDALMENPKAQIQRIAHTFSLSINNDELACFIKSFLDPSLRHHTENEATTHDCASSAAKLYAKLLPLAHEQSADMLENPRITRGLTQVLASCAWKNM